MNNKFPIKDATGKIWGWVQIDANGDKKATDYKGKIVGYYKVFNNATYDYKGKLIAWGDVVGSLIKIGN